MVQIYTIGGGPYVVQVINAVAAWTHSGGYISFLQVVMMLGFLYVIVLTLFDMAFQVMWRWFLTTTVIYGVLMVPVETVQVVDPVNPNFGQSVVANVPLGLAEFAGLTSQIGQYLTTNAEALFNVPNNQQYSQNGMIYGARLMEQVHAVDIDKPGFAANVDNYIRSCVFYDVMMNNTSVSTIANAGNDLWGSLASSNAALQTQVLTLNNNGDVVAGSPASSVPCNQAYTTITQQWQTFLTGYASRFGSITYANLSNALASQKLAADLPAVYNAITANASAAPQILQQSLAVNAFMAARANANGSPNMASIDSFAQARADVQSQYTYNTIAEGARKWVPVLNIVLTVVFYAMFPVLFPLFLLPQTGMAALKGYLVGFFYLAAWGPLYAILNMFLVTSQVQNTLAVVGTSGGLALSNASGIHAVNNEIAELSGYLLALVPFIAAGMAKGAMAIGGSATAFLAPSQNAAEAAASEAATGNYSYGNVSFANLQANNASTWQRQLAPSLTTGAARQITIEPSGATSTTYGEPGHPTGSVYDYSGSFSRYPTSAASNDNIAERQDREASTLQTQSVDVSKFQRQVQDWAKSSSHASGGNRTNSGGTQSGATNTAGLQSSVFATSDKSHSMSDTDGQTDSDRSSHGARISAFSEGHIGTPGAGVLGSGVSLGARAEGNFAREKSSAVAHTSQSSDARNKVDGARVSTDVGFVKSDGSYNKVDHSTFNSWNNEQRDAYVRSIGTERKNLESAAMSFRESAAWSRSHSNELRQDLNHDLETAFRESPDLAGFQGGGLALLRKSPGEMTAVEYRAYSKALGEFQDREAASQALKFSDDKQFITERYKLNAGRLK